MSVNRTSTQAHDGNAITGIQKHLQTAASMPLAGSPFTPSELVTFIQSRLDSAREASAAKANWHTAVLTDKALNTRLKPVLAALRQYVINVYGATSPILADFGFLAPKRATRTPEQKAASVAKAKATRAARHTLGKNQKKAVKGDVTGVVVTPVTAPKATGSAPATPTPASPAGTPATPVAPLTVATGPGGAAHVTA